MSFRPGPSRLSTSVAITTCCRAILRGMIPVAGLISSGVDTVPHAAK